MSGLLFYALTFYPSFVRYQLNYTLIVTGESKNMSDCITNIDSNGNINESYYNNAIRDLTKRYLTELYPETTKYTSNHLLAVMSHIYDSLFRPDGSLLYNQKSNIPYTTNNIQILFNIYIKLYNDYLCLPSLYSFSRMTGISEDALERYLTAGKSEVSKTRKEMVQNKLYETPIGVTVLANNEESVGLMYNRQNMIDKQTVSRNISLSDIRQIAQKSDET